MFVMLPVLRTIKSVTLAYPILIFLFIALLFCIIFVPNFATAFNLRNLSLQITDTLIIACGLTFVVLNGSIDFSATSILALSSIVGAYIMAISPFSESPALAIPLAVIVMILIGAIVGAVNGISVIRLKIPAFIATMSTMLIGSATAIWLASVVSEHASSSIGGLPRAFFVLGGLGNAFFIPIAISLLVILFADWLLKKTKFGRQVYAVGTNPKASFISGMPVKRTIFFLFLISGTFAGIQSVLLTARNQAGISGMGSTIFIYLIASVIIGGTSVTGGFGGVRQTFLGVLFISLMNNGMNMLGVEWYIIALFQGILIFIATLFDYLIKKSGSFVPVGANKSR